MLRNRRGPKPAMVGARARRVTGLRFATIAPMRGIWILGGLAAGAIALAFFLLRASSADIERAFQDATAEQPAIEASLAESSELIRYFSDRKPIERKKSDLQKLRDRLANAQKSAAAIQSGDGGSKEERHKQLHRLQDEYSALHADADDLRARLREMKHYDEALRPVMARLGDLTVKVAKAQSESSDPVFQQRATGLIDDAKRFRSMAEGALQTLSNKITEGRTLGTTALNELATVMKRMNELLASLEPAESGAR